MCCRDLVFLPLTAAQSIDLTRLPAISQFNNTISQHGESTPRIEYSAREVSPAPLLLAQVLAANRTFLLHHGPTLSDLYVRVNRDKFCGILDRFWGRFCRNWEVLLHGNPAVEVFGGMKLAAGGELGMGVGEEDWGSGEREVLEDLVRQTEGLVDLTVSRFGQAAPPEPDNAADDPSDKTLSDAQSGLPWLGCGNLPDASDGVIFGGMGAIARSSLRDISSWVQEVYTYGEHAYGVKDNPQRQRRKRRRRPPPTEDDEEEPANPSAKKVPDKSTEKAEGGNALSFPLPHDSRSQTGDTVASLDHASGTSSPQVASHPGIPPPIVTAAEESLNAASRAAALQQRTAPAAAQNGGSRFGISKQWMGILTLGLSNVGGSNSTSLAPPSRPDAPRRTSSSSSRTIRPSASRTSTRRSKEPDIPEQDEDGPMRTLDPAPDGYELTDQLARQRHLESKGHFLVGYQGELDKPDSTADDASNISDEETDGERNMLRTIQVEVPPASPSQSEDGSQDEASDTDSSTDGYRGPKHQRLRILIYVHRPFIYTFLFEQRAPFLQITSFYRTLHHHLQPLHKPLLRSTSLQQVALRIAEAYTSPSSPTATNPESPPYQPPKSSPVFDLVHDPVTLTTHTSIPNIPDPGSLAAEGFATSSTGRNDPPPWTRIEAINVHSQILNTLIATKPNKLETERTSKTTRGWWVVWLRIPATPTDGGAQAAGRERFEDCRTAFLVRKASDGSAGRGGGGVSRSLSAAGRRESAMGSMGGMMGMGAMGSMFGFGGPDKEEEREDQEGRSVGWGLGIDPRKYVEGLLSLNR